MGGVKTRDSSGEENGGGARPLRESGDYAGSTGGEKRDCDPGGVPSTSKKDKKVGGVKKERAQRRTEEGAALLRNVPGGKAKTGDGSGSGPDKRTPEQVNVSVAPHLRTAVSALLAAGLEAQEAVAVASFMQSGEYDPDEDAEGLGFGEGGEDAAAPGERHDAQSVSYASMAAASFDRTRQALDK